MKNEISQETKSRLNGLTARFRPDDVKVSVALDKSLDKEAVAKSVADVVERLMGEDISSLFAPLKKDEFEIFLNLYNSHFTTP